MTVTVNIHEAKTHLSRLIERVSQGQEVVIAKAGRPVVRMVPVEPPPKTRRLGFMAGHGQTELDVKDGFGDEIESMFAR